MKYFENKKTKATFTLSTLKVVRVKVVLFFGFCYGEFNFQIFCFLGNEKYLSLKLNSSTQNLCRREY